MVLVTGGTGLVGSHVIRLLILKGEKVKALYRPNSTFELVGDIKDKVEWVKSDVLDVDDLSHAFEGVTKVVHAAAIVSFDKRLKGTMLKVNIEGTENVVNESLVREVDRFVHVSSVAAVGGLSKKEVDEQEKWETSDTHSAYGESKYRSELEVWRGVEEGLNANIVNPSVVLGEANYHKSSSQLFDYAINRGNRVVDNTLNVVDVRDVAKAIVLLLDSDVTNQRFILNKGRISYKDLFTKVRSTIGLEGPKKTISKTTLFYLEKLSFVWSILTFSRPLLTKEIVQSLTKTTYYRGRKITQALGFEYTPIEETIEWCCSSLVDKKD